MFTEFLVSLEPLYILSVLVFSTYFFVTYKFTSEGIAFVSTALLIFYRGFVSHKPLALLESMLSAPVITILGLTVLGRLIACTGVVNKTARLIVKTRAKCVIPTILIFICYVLSAFVNNTPVVILLVSVVSVFGKQIGLPNSRIMMPIAFAASLGGMLTLLGSSTNLLIYSKAREFGTELELFGFFMPGLFIGMFGMIYVALLTFILPQRDGAGDVPRKFFFVLNPVQGERLIFSAVGIQEIKNILYNCAFRDNLVLDEVVITEKSQLIGSDIFSSKVAGYFNACAVGVTGTSGKIVSGSRLVVVCKSESLRCVDDVVVVAKSRVHVLSNSNGIKVISAFIGMIILSGVFRTPLALIIFSVLALLTALRVINVRDIFGFIEVKLLLMLIYSLTLGRSLEVTGLLDDFSNFLYQWTYTLPILGSICLIFAMVSLLNEVMSNNAVGLIFTPVVLKLGHMLGVDPIYLVWALIFASNSAFATPFGYQVNLIVMDAGKYKFSDYLKFGLPLNVVVFVAYIVYLWLFSELDLLHRTLVP